MLGISGSPRRGEVTDGLVQAVLAGCEGCETSFISLAGMDIAPCSACLGCIESNACVVEDSFADLREMLLGADAYVVGAPTYFGTLNALTHCFFERFFQFRHREVMLLKGRFGVAVGVGGKEGLPAALMIQEFFEKNRIVPIGSVSAQGAFACHKCGYGVSCQVGGFHKTIGEAEITPAIIPNLAKQPWKVAEAEALGRRLVRRMQVADGP